MDVLESTRFLMKKYGITASKALGQNFLVNEDVLDRIVGASRGESR